MTQEHPNQPINKDDPAYTPTEQELIETAVMGAILIDEKDTATLKAHVQAIGAERIKQDTEIARTQAQRALDNITKEAYRNGYEKALNLFNEYGVVPPFKNN